MKAVDPGHRPRGDRSVEHAVLDHSSSAGPALLGGLEDHRHRTGEPAPLGEVREPGGGAEHDRGVAVVSAGVHATGNRRGPGKVVLLVDREGVDVGSQAHDFAGVRTGKPGKHPRAPGQSGAVLDPESLQFIHDQPRGAVLLVGDLGMGVEIVAEFRGAIHDRGVEFGKKAGGHDEFTS